MIAFSFTCYSITFYLLPHLPITYYLYYYPITLILYYHHIIYYPISFIILLPLGIIL